MKTPIVDFVTNYGAGGLVLMLKEELTKGVSTLLEEAQKGVYGIQFLPRPFRIPLFICEKSLSPYKIDLARTLYQ